MAAQIRALVSVADLESPACAICGQRQTEFHIARNGFEIVRCRQDGLIFTSPRPLNLAPFYDERYYSGGMPGVYQDYAKFANESLVPEWNKRLDAMEKAIGQAGLLLDVGCAMGCFLNTARSRSWDVAGIEISQWAADSARKTYGLSVFQGSLPEKRLTSGRYDVVTMWDCIEHLSDPRAVLQDVQMVLSTLAPLLFCPSDDSRAS